MALLMVKLMAYQKEKSWAAPKVGRKLTGKMMGSLTVVWKAEAMENSRAP